MVSWSQAGKPKNSASAFVQLIQGGFFRLVAQVTYFTQIATGVHPQQAAYTLK
jgi:hypothetical protein